MDLAAACTALAASSAGPITSAEQLGTVLSATEAACIAVTAALKLPDTDLSSIQSAIAAVASATTAVHTALEAQSSHLQAVARGGWVAAVLGLAEASLFGVNHHSALGQEQATVRNLLRDCVLPILLEASKQQSGDTGFQLQAEYQAVLSLAHTAAEVIGWRDERTAATSSMRHYGTVNVLWLPGVLNLWAAVPVSLRPQLEDHGLGVVTIVRQVVGYLTADMASLCEGRHDVSDVRLLQFWIQFVNKMVAAFPEAASATWSAVLRWLLEARQLVQALCAGGSLAPKAQEAVDSIAKGALWSRGSRSLASCLNVLSQSSEDGVQPALEALTFVMASDAQLAPGRSGGALAALHTALDLLKEAAAMKPAVRAACQALVGASFHALMGPAFEAGLTAQLPTEVARASLVFMGACCDAASGSSPGDPGDGLVSLQQETWDRCQVELCRLAVTPHPIMAAALGELWSAIICPCDPAIARQHITAVHDLLEAAAAAGAGAGPNLALSPLVQQLAGLLACLLSAASPSLAEDCLLGFLQASAVDDTCSLACLSAELQVAKLAGAAAGSAACMVAVRTMLQQLSMLLDEAVSIVPALDPASEEAAHLAWLIDCIASGIAALGSAAEGAPPPDNLARNLVRILAIGATSEPVPGYAAPALAALCNMRGLDGALLHPDLLKELLPALETLLRDERTAALATALAPAYKATPGFHLANLWGSILTASEPVLAHLGVEAYLEFIRGCRQGNVLGVLPPQLVDRESGAMCAALKARVEAHLRRCPPPACEGAGAEDIRRSWASSLQAEATDALQQLHLAHAAWVASASRQPREASTAVPAATSAAAQRQPGAGQIKATQLAYEAVLSAVVRLEQALAASGPGTLPVGAAAALLSRLRALQ